MMPFYISIIFVGIFLIVVALISIAIDRRKSYDYINDINERKRELTNIVNDAEQMIQELNRFSDYVITRIDQKSEELNSNMKSLDEKISKLNSMQTVIPELKEDRQKKSKVNTPDGLMQKGKTAYQEYSDIVSDSLEQINTLQDEQTEQANVMISKEKISNSNSRHKEIIKLSQNGLNAVEIAKKLNVGMGEVELVLGLNKG